MSKAIKQGIQNTASAYILSKNPLNDVLMCWNGPGLSLT